MWSSKFHSWLIRSLPIHYSIIFTCFYILWFLVYSLISEVWICFTKILKSLLLFQVIVSLQFHIGFLLSLYLLPQKYKFLSLSMNDLYGFSSIIAHILFYLYLHVLVLNLYNLKVTFRLFIQCLQCNDRFWSFDTSAASISCLFVYLLYYTGFHFVKYFIITFIDFHLQKNTVTEELKSIYFVS